MIRKTVLDNGVRIVSEKVPGVRSVAIGIWVCAGSRYEANEDAGVSHLIEHLLFKGTERRTGREITEAIESVGGQLNAFTSKEYTCYYARVLDEHLPLAIDVLSDMFFSSLFAPEDIEKEKQVVEEEIRMFEDTPDEIIHDLFTQTIWDGHPLGRPVIGTLESVRNLTREKVLDYYRNYYSPPHIVVAAAGNADHEQIVDLLGPSFSNVSQKPKEHHVTPPKPHPGFKIFYKDLEQVQVCIGVPGPDQYDERIYALQILNNVLGGDAGSRLFQKIREERGLVYSVYSYYSVFQDAGLITVYAGTSPSKLEEVLELIQKELESIAKEGITQEELEKTKEQIKGSLFLALESVSTRMQRLGKFELMYKRYLSPEEIIGKILRVTREDVLDLARSCFDQSKLTITVLGKCPDKEGGVGDAPQ
jgi:predicted Zn-dependent peptidase